MADTKTHVAVVFGGRSGEHAVSLMSAKFVLQMLNPARYQVTQIGITRDGAWVAGDGVLAALEAENVSGLQAATLLADPTRAGIKSISSTNDGELLQTLADVDVVFPVLHGTYGEDGTLQGLLEMAGVAYVGAGVLGSSVGMDKALFADVMKANNIPVADSVLLLRSEIQNDTEAAIAKAESVSKYPLFIKPANLGSSVGVSKANNRSDLLEALMYAAQYDRRIVVQRGYNAREIEVSVLGNDAPEASVCGEVAPEAEFYSYEAKYHDDRSKTYIPADIPAGTSERIRELAVKAYLACDLAGLARVDFFLDRDTGEVVLNEVNTLPGFTSISMYPQLWKASGLDGEALVDRLVKLALERRAERAATVHEYRRGG
ncbi:MAG: D-alanine--D-alanine ligase [Anaerolineales bacterium]|nr:MAG: D-alanine--D-alanine ligase [Anaerolineales bacterium]